jgi:hypothetical protein
MALQDEIYQEFSIAPINPKISMKRVGWKWQRNTDD